MSTPYLDSIAEITATVMREINDDIAEGIVPESVRTFSELHDWVDACRRNVKNDHRAATQNGPSGR